MKKRIVAMILVLTMVCGYLPEISAQSYRSFTVSGTGMRLRSSAGTARAGAGEKETAPSGDQSESEAAAPAASEQEAERASSSAEQPVAASAPAESAASVTESAPAESDASVTESVPAESAASVMESAPAEPAVSDEENAPAAESSGGENTAAVSADSSAESAMTEPAGQDGETAAKDSDAVKTEPAAEESAALATETAPAVSGAETALAESDAPSTDPAPAAPAAANAPVPAKKNTTEEAPVISTASAAQNRVETASSEQAPKTGTAEVVSTVDSRADTPVQQIEQNVIVTKRTEPEETAKTVAVVSVLSESEETNEKAEDAAKEEAEDTSVTEESAPTESPEAGSDGQPGKTAGAGTETTEQAAENETEKDRPAESNTEEEQSADVEATGTEPANQPAVNDTEEEQPADVEATGTKPADQPAVNDTEENRPAEDETAETEPAVQALADETPAAGEKTVAVSAEEEAPQAAEQNTVSEIPAVTDGKEGTEEQAEVGTAPEEDGTGAENETEAAEEQAELPSDAMGGAGEAAADSEAGLTGEEEAVSAEMAEEDEAVSGIEGAEDSAEAEVAEEAAEQAPSGAAQLASGLDRAINMVVPVKSGLTVSDAGTEESFEELSDDAETVPAAAGDADQAEPEFDAVATEAASFAVVGLTRGDGDDKEEGSGISTLEALIQSTIREKFKGGVLKGKLEVILEKNNTYEKGSNGNDIIINIGNRDVEDDFELELSAEDAGTDGHSGEGFTVIGDNIVIKGVKVTMNSIMIAPEAKITVQKETISGSNKGRDGALVFNGVDALTNTLNVDARAGAQVEINLGDKNDVINVTAESGAESVTVNAGDGANNITAVISGGDFHLTSGDGNDNVDLSLIASGESPTVGDLNVSTGGGLDTVYVMDNARVDENRDITYTESVWNEEKQEAEEVEKTRKAAPVIQTGSGDDTLIIDVRSNAGNLNVDTGSGGDTVTVWKGDVDTGEDFDRVKHYEPYETVTANSTAVITLQNSDPGAMDRITIFADASRSIKEVAIRGGKGASVHLKGDLGTHYPENDGGPISRISDGIRLHTDFNQTGQDYTLDITMQQPEENPAEGEVQPRYILTDTLKNKNKVELKPAYDESTKTYTYSGELKDFTDYVLDKKMINKLDQITILNTGNTRPLLSNLILDKGNSNLINDDENNLHVHSVDARDLNVVLKGRIITVDGEIKARNIRAEATAKPHGFPFNALFDGSTNIIDMLVNIYEKAQVTIKDSAKLESEEDTVLYAKVRQSGNMLTVTGLPVNLKIADVGVSIDGSMKAGGSVVADSILFSNTNVRTTKIASSGPDYEMVPNRNGDFASVILQFSNSEISVSDAARIIAGEDILLRAENDITLYSDADGKKGFTFAAALINSTVNNEVEGTLEAGNRVVISAQGTVNEEAISQRSTGKAASEKDNYLGFSIVNQKVDAVIRGARIKAGGDVMLNSVAKANVKTVADADADKKKVSSPTAGSFKPGKIVVNVIKLLAVPIGNFFGWVGEKYKTSKNPNWKQEQFEELLNKVTASEYEVKAIKLDEESAEHGSTSVSVKVGKAQNGKKSYTYATVDTQPDAGYEVGAVYYRYLGSSTNKLGVETLNDAYTYVRVEPNDEGKYIFKLEHPNTLYEVIVDYVKPGEEQEAAQQDPASSKVPLRRKLMNALKKIASVFSAKEEKINLDDLDDGFNLGGLLDEGNENLKNDPAAEEKDPAKEFVIIDKKEDVPEDKSHKLKLNNPSINNPLSENVPNRLLTWQVNAEGKSLDTVYEGQSIRFIGNCKKGQELKKLTIKYYYYNENHSKTDTEATIEADGEGRFIFEVPETLIPGTEIDVKAEFGDIDNKKAPNHLDETGAITLAYVSNKGEAKIESRLKTITSEPKTKTYTVGGINMELEYFDEVTESVIAPVIIAGGKLTLVGTAGTVSTNLADARKVAKPDSENADDDEEEKKNYAQGTTGHWDNLYTQYAIRATSTLQGKDEGLIATNKKDEGATGAFHPIFKINPDQAYDRDKSVILVSYYTKANLKAPSWPIDISYGGKLLTTEISLDDDSVTIADDGTITYKPNFASFGLEDGKLDGAFKEGTTVDVEFVFRDAEGEVLTSGTGESKYAVTNPVVTQYNYLIDEDKTEPLSFTNESDGMGVLEAGGISIGSVTYKSYEDGVYKYVIAPAKGYKVDCKSENFTIDHKSNTDKLYASWKGLSGTEYRIALVCDSLDYDKAEVWTLNLKDENIAPPAGAVITINAVFEEDARKIKVDNPEDKSKNHGNIKINKEAGKTGDTIVVKAEEKDGWAITGIKLSTLNGESDFRDDPSFGDKETTKIISFNGEKKIKFKVPEYVDSIAITDYLKIEPIYAERNVLVRTEDNIQLSDKSSKLFSGETIKVTPSAEEIKKGMKIDQITVVGGEVKGKDSFTITAGNNEEIRVSATLKQKDYQVGSFTDNEKNLGSIEPVSGYADAGDIVLLNIKPKEGYRAKDGTVTVTITTDKGVKKIKAYWNALNQYAFKLVKPSGEEIRKIEVEGKFEKGEDGLNKSAGVAASVNWVTGSSKVEIDSGFISAEQGIQLSSVSNGNKASSEAYAGYNSAKNAGAGALSIQVASFTSDAVIRKNDGKYLEKAKDELEDDEKTAEAVRKILGEAVTTRLDTSMAPESVLHIGSGALTVKAKNSGSFTTVGDAANKKKQSAEGMGVGAGVVFSISKLETIAETRNGLRFADQDLSLRGLDGETFYEYVNTPSEITGINISATQRMSDKAQAAAGAAGGSVFVPVAVIDILNSETRAQMGMLDLSDENREEAARLSPILDKTGFTDDELDLYRANELNQVGLAIALSSHKPADDQRKLIDNGTITDVELAAVISGIKLSKDETSKLRKGKMSAADQAAILKKTGWTAEAISALRNGTLPESELLSRLGTGLTSQELGQLKAGRTTQALKEALRAEKPTDEQMELIYNGTLKMTGPITVKASSESAMAEYNHELTADASAQGGQTAMGGAFIISWMDNEVRAKLNQSIDTDGDITINSGASDALSATATASASGGDKGKDGSSDKQANHLLSGGANMAGGYGGMDRGKILSDGKNRQQLESPENSVAGAGAVVLNMQFVKSRAEIPDRINIDTDGRVEVRSVNRTVANIKANASTTKSNTGVGIGAALNIVKMENIARIGNGSIRASELQIKAEVADGPEMNRTQSVAQEATGFTDQLSQTIKQFIIDNLGETTYKWLGGDDDQEGPIVAFIQTFLAELIKELNLEKVFAAASGSASIEGFKAVGDLLLERLKAFPEKLAAPVITTYKEILGTFGDWDKDKAEALWDDVVGIFVTQAIGNLADSVRTNFVQTAMTDIMNGALEMVGNWMNGKGLDGTKVKEKLLTSVTNLLKESINKTIDSVFLYMSEQLPLLSKNNMRLVLEIKENKDKILKEMKSGVGNILKNDIAPYVLEVFKNEVYDYEPIAIKIKESGIKDFFIKELKTLVAKSTAAMTNQAINMLVSKLNVKLPVESSGDRHVFTTKAISGAGTTGSGGAGSLALAVILLTTKAEIAGGRNPVTVTGDVTLNAEETRRIRTHSSAAIDARGEPDNNSGDEQEEESGTTTKTFYGPDKKFTVKTTLGGIVTFEGDGTDTTVYLKPDKGYRIADDSVTRSYHEKNHEPADDQLDVARFNDEIMIVPYQDIKGKGGDIEDLIVNVKFEEDLHKVPVPEVTDPDFQVGVSVEGREPKNNEIEAKYGDFVYVIVPVTDWHENIRVQYTEGNENREISLTANPKEFSVVSQNSKETVYAFRMPDGDISKINVSKDHEKTEAEKKADEKKAKSESKDAAGRSIGVGGAFSITYGNSDVKAQIGTRKQVLTNEDGSVTEIDEENRQLDGEVNEEGDGSNLEKVYAETGREGFSAGTLTITASSRHEEENFATGGTDPFAGTDTKNASPKDKSYDFSVSLNILDNDIFAGVAKGTKVTVTGAAGGKEEVPTGTEEGGEEKEEELGEDEPEEIEAKKGDIVISATEVSANETRANAFATGKNTGVGASAAVNVSLSDITATLGSGATAPGDITVRGHSLNKDQTWSMATSVGADVQRTLNKFADGVDKTKEKLNDLTSGKIFDNWVNNREANKDSNKTNKRITGRLNAQGDANGSKAGSSLATSINVLRSQNILVDNGEDANQAANNADDNDDDDDDDDDDFWGQLGRELGEDREVIGEQNAQGQENKNKKQKLQLAATVGFTVGFHKVRVDVGDDLTSLEGKIDLIARNANNFRTRATAAAMSLEKAENGGNDIAAAVGVSINKNKALISMEGNLEAAKDVTLDSNLTQNLTDGYKGYLAVQSVSGAISGKGYDYSIAGALSFMISLAESKAVVKGAEKISGENVTINAYDKSKLGIRAGAINFSTGAAKGGGVSIGTIWSGNTVRAEVNDGAAIRADAFKMNAEKAKVSWSDFKFPFDLKQVLSDSSELTDEQRENVQTGLIDVHREPGQKTYTVDFNISSYALMNFLDNINVLSSQNYYVETVAGSLIKGRAKDNEPNALNATGSISLVRTKNIVDAILGKNVTIRNRDWTDEDEAELADGQEKALANNSVSVTASGDTNGRLIAGAISAGSAKNSAGISLTFQIDSDEVNLKAGDGLSVRAGGDVKFNASGDTRIQTINAAAAASTEEEAKYTAGGGLNVLALKNIAKTSIGDGAEITSGALDIGARSELELLLISVSLAGAKTGVAAGGTVNGIRDRAKSQVEIGKDQNFRAETGDMNIHAKTVDKMMIFSASASAATKTDDNEAKAGAGNLSVLDSKTVGTVRLGESQMGLVAEKGSIAVTGDADTRAVNVTLAAAGAKKTAVGLNANLNFFRRTSGVEIEGGEGYVIRAGKNVMTSAYGNDTSIIAAMAVSASKEGAGSGNLPISVSSNNIYNKIGTAQITAGGEAAFASRLKDMTLGISGNVAVQVDLEETGEGNAAGAGAVFVFKKNTVETNLGSSSVTANGNSGELYQAMLKDKRIIKNMVKGSDGKEKEQALTGILVHSASDDFVVGVAAGVVVSTGKNGVNANLLVNSNKNNITADAGNAALDATSGGISVRANGDSLQWAVAGGLNVSHGNSAGAALAVLTSSKNVKALGHILHAKNDIEVIADNVDKVRELTVNVGAATSSEGKVTLDLGISLQILKSKVNAAVASDVKSTEGSFTLKAKNNGNMDNINVALAASRSKFTTTPVFALTYYGGETNALLGSGTVDVKKAVSILADSRKDIDQVTIGASAGTGAALSGAISLMFLKDHTNALVAHGTSISGGSLDVIADSNYDLTGASVALAGSFSGDSKPGGSVNGMLTLAKSSTLAEMEGKVNVSGPARIKAVADRDIVEAGLAGGFSMNGVAAGVTAMFLVAGDRMDQDAANMLTYGSGKEEKEKVLDVDAVIRKLKSLGVNTSDLEEHTVTPDPRDPDSSETVSGIAADLTGNGKSSNNVQTSDGQSFDAVGGYTDYSSEGGDKDNDEQENRDMNESDDVFMARGVGTTVYQNDPKDSVVARVAADASIEAGDVSVMASQDTKADLFGAAAGVSVKGMGGLGVSFGLALLRSNVIAASLGEIDAKNGEVVISAVSTAGNVKGAEGSDEEARTKALNEQMPNTGNILTRSIRAVGLAVGVGASAEGSGIAVAGGVVRTDNLTKATLGGKVKNAAKLTVGSEMQYDNVLATTVSLAGGGKGAIAGSLAISLANGTADTRIIDGTEITGSNTKIGMTNTGIINARALAVTAAAAGKGSIAGGVAVARNNLKQNTIIEKGATIDLTGDSGELKMKGTSITTSNTYLVNVAIGGKFGVGIGLGLSTVSPTIRTMIGVDETHVKHADEKDEEDEEEKEAEETNVTADDRQVSLGRLNSVKILNDLSSEANALLVSAAGGANAGVSLNGLLVFNDTIASAQMGAASGDLNTLAIDSDITSKGDSTFGSINVGTAAVGLSISYVDVTAKNEAKLNTDNFTATVRDTLTVTTNQGISVDNTMRNTDKLTSSAHALSIAGSLGLYGAVGLNAAAARNRTQNVADISGKNGVSAAKVVLQAFGKGSAKTEMIGVAVSAGVAVGASVGISINEATSLAKMKVGGAVEADMDFETQMTGETDTNLLTGGGGLGSLTVNVARSYGRTNSIIDVDIAKAPAKVVSLRANAHGQDDVTTTINNQNFSAIAVAAMVGYTYNQDVYSANVKLRGGEYGMKNASVIASYQTSSEANVTPSASGVSLSGAKIEYNIAKSNSTAFAGAELDLENATLDMQETGNVEVYSGGAGSSFSQMHSAKYLELSAIKIAANITRADYKARQAAVLGLNNGKIKNAMAVKVHSSANQAGAESIVGTGGFEDDDPSVEITLVDLELNSAYAKEDLQATAMIQGQGGSEVNSIGAKSLTVASSPMMLTSAKAKSQTAWSIGAYSIGGFDTKATSGDLYYTAVNGFTADITDNIDISARGNSKSYSIGSAPGSISLGFDIDISTVKARMGSEDDPETAMVLVGDDTVLNSTAGSISLKAENEGNTSTDFESKTYFSVGAVKDSDIPTESYYNTGVLIGKGSTLNAKAGKVTIQSRSSHDSKSEIDAFSLGLAFNYSKMMGMNTIRDENNIDIGEGSKVNAKNDINVSAVTSTKASAKTVLKGGSAFYSGEFVKCENDIERAAGIHIGDSVTMNSSQKGITIRSAAGEGDNIVADAYVKSGGFVSIGDGEATNRIKTTNQINIGQGVQIIAQKDVNLLVRATSKLAGGDKNVLEEGNPGDDDELPINGQEPEEEPTEEEQEEINRRRAAKEQEAADIQNESDEAYKALEPDERPELKSRAEGEGQLNTKDDDYGIYAKTVVKAKGAAVWPDAKSVNRLDYFNLININRNETANAKYTTIRSMSGNILAMADNDGLKVKAQSKATGGALYGDADAWSEIDASLQNTVWVDNANLQAMNPGMEAALLVRNYGDGQTGERPYMNADAYADNNSLFGGDEARSVIQGKSYNQIKSFNTLTVRTRGSFVHVAKNPVDSVDYTMKGDRNKTNWAWGAAKRRCDFCYGDKGQSSTVDYRVAIDRRDMEAILSAAFVKALRPVRKIREKADDAIETATKSSYGEIREMALDEEIYAMDLITALTKDTTLNSDQIARARLWTNVETATTLYVLPNASQLHMLGTGIQYVTETLSGDVLGNGETHDVEIISALNDYAFRRPVIGIGENGLLDFRTGTVLIPSLAEFELYLEEISGKWMIEQMQSGYLTRADGDQDRINDSMLQDKDLPEIHQTEGMTAETEQQGWTRWWLGHTPETAESAEETLVYLMVSGETDEVDAYRTSVEMMERKAAPVDVSVFIFRDSEADRRNEEKYLVVFYDTPAGEKSKVGFYTQTMTDITYVPNSLRIVLRAWRLSGADLPGFAMSGCFYAMNDATDGKVNMFDGAYEATLKDKTFESDYIRIEDITADPPQIILRKGQPVWAERTGEDSAKDLNGGQYQFVGDEWVPVTVTVAKTRN